MQQFLDLFWQIALFRRSPSDLPESTFLLTVVVGAYLLINIITVFLAGEAGQSFLLLLTDLVLLTGWAFAVLTLFGKQARLMQTLTALFGVGSVLQFLSLPLSLGIDTNQDWLIGLSVLGFLFILLWAVAVYGYVIARAIDRSAGVGVLLSTGYFLLSFQLAALLIPAN